MSKLALLLLSVALHGPVLAQDHPTRPIRVIVPTAPGGFTDGFVQLIGEALRATWGQGVVMEHRPGAGGILGTDAAAKAAPDGYTLPAGNIGPLALAPYLEMVKLPYDLERDFVPVKLLATFANVLVVDPPVPAGTIDELIRLAKARPGALHFASPGIGQSQHMSAELCERSQAWTWVRCPTRARGRRSPT
jgi:tripartite-type tricarboxylate transporter receptor subunit TctC